MNMKVSTGSKIRYMGEVAERGLQAFSRREAISNE
jgi:hypothetical protein